MEHSIDVENHVSVVLRALTVTVIQPTRNLSMALESTKKFAGVLGAGGHRSNLVALPICLLGNELPWLRLGLGRHGSVVNVNLIGILVISVALFAICVI